MRVRAAVGVELFAGCGGMSTGFLDAGLRVAAGFEIDRRAVDAYNYNHSYRGSLGVQADLSEMSGKAILEAAGLRSIDFLIGGPPCQPFSIAGKQQGRADRRASLVDHYVRLLGELSPQVFMFENVPNLATIQNGEILAELLDAMRRKGFAVESKVVSAADFGVPQNRKRLVVMGSRTKHPIGFPDATTAPSDLALTCGFALRDLPDAGEFGENGIFNHEPTFHSQEMIERFRRLAPGTREKGSFHDRLHPGKPSYTLRAGSGNFSPLRPVHFKYDRVITVRESARLQGFEDSFIWPDRIPRLQQYRQVGNAVPPPLAKAFASYIAASFSWNLRPGEFVGDAHARESAISMTDAQRRAQRVSRTRGASLGRLA